MVKETRENGDDLLTLITGVRNLIDRRHEKINHAILSNTRVRVAGENLISFHREISELIQKFTAGVGMKVRIEKRQEAHRSDNGKHHEAACKRCVN